MPLLSPHSPSRDDFKDYGALAFCSVVWGTTWFAIKFQLGHVDPLASIVYRFALSGAALLGFLALSGRSPRLSRRQHILAAAQGLPLFAGSYAFVYSAEALIPSAVVAVIFAAFTLTSLILFRLIFKERPSLGTWGGAWLGVAGVAALSAGQLLGAKLGAGAALGVGFALCAVVCSAFGNVFAHMNQKEGVAPAALAGWAMVYGAAGMTLFRLVTGGAWSFDPSPAYVGSLIYLSLFGSVLSFVLYYWLASRRGFALASYTSALAPPTAMLVSGLFEQVRWGPAAFLGLILVVAGQLLVIRTRK